MTSIGKRKITLKNVEKLLESIISRKIHQEESRKMYNSIADDANKLNRLLADYSQNLGKKFSLF